MPHKAHKGTQRFFSHSFSVVLYCCTDLWTASTVTAWGLYTSSRITCFLRFPSYVMTRTTRDVASVTYRRLPIQSTARPRISVVDWLITTGWKQNQKMLRVLLDFSLCEWPRTTVWKQEEMKFFDFFLNTTGLCFVTKNSSDQDFALWLKTAAIRTLLCD